MFFSLSFFEYHVMEDQISEVQISIAWRC